MSKFGRFSFLVSCSLAVAVAALAPSAALFAATPGTASVATGGAVVTQAPTGSTYSEVLGGPLKPLTVGTTLKPGAKVTAPAGGEVRLDLGVNGNLLIIHPGSTLQINALEINGPEVNTQLEVNKGTISGNVKKLSKTSKYEVKTSTGVAGIRGTSFTLMANGTIHCHSGTVVFVVPGAPGQPPVTVTIQAGQSVTITSGGAPVVITTPDGLVVPVGITQDNGSDSPLVVTTPTTEPLTFTSPVQSVDQ
jgi:hypothetical protein